MKNLLVTALAALVLASCGNPATPKEEWISLFNGENLD